MQQVVEMEQKLERLTLATEKLVERIASLEKQIDEWRQSGKPVIYVDEETCLLSSQEADIEFMQRKIRR